jgi:hypothetical protein
MVQPRKVSVTLPDNRQAQGIEIDVDVANERWSEFKLTDGTVFRCKVNIVSVVRVENEYDAAGTPVYQINAAPAVAFIEVPEHLKKGKSQ